ncbi:MAG: threonine/serine exporter family protein, partial [Thermoanaerobaculia bacterium]
AWLGIIAAAAPDTLPTWNLPAALIVSAVGMTVLFKAIARDLPHNMLAATVSFSGSRIGTLAFGPELGVLLGAWLVGTLGHLAGRWRNHPSAVGILPGMLLLVPGGLSFTTLSALLANDPVSGIQAGFSTLLFALSLVTGLLLSSLTSRSHEDF